jgi:SAM-dependent methyltransferase
MTTSRLSNMAKAIRPRLGRLKRRILFISKAFSRDTRMIQFGKYPSPPELTRTQRMFVEWNAERLQIPSAESLERYLSSWRSLPQGHSGADYREYCGLSYKIFKIFCDNNSTEVYEAYKFHAPFHFLRFLSYNPGNLVEDAVLDQLIGRDPIVILDYGCGLAQASHSLVERLEGKGSRAKLILVDIPTLMKDFLIWVGDKLSLPTEFIDCDIDTPYPTLPRCDICIATEVFEHIHDPIRAFRNIDDALAVGGYLIANIRDHGEEYFHVAPDLASLRAEVEERGYRNVGPSVFVKMG